MGAFGGITLTNKGRNLQAKAQTGKPLKYTRISIGDGQLAGQSMATLNRLISEKKSLPITKLKIQTAGRAVVGSVLSNQDVTTGFYFREIGIFATDPDEGEILYGYGNAGENAEYIPPSGGADLIEKEIDMIVIVGQAQNVSAVIETSSGVTEDELATAIDEAKNESLPKTGGTLTGPLNIEANGEGLALKGQGLSFASFYPEGEAAGRKGFVGFGQTGQHKVIIANEYPDGDIIFRQKGQDTTLDSLIAKPTTEQVTQAVNAAKTEAANTYMPKATTQATGDWNNYTTNGNYDGQGLANSPKEIDASIGVNWYYVEVKSHSLDASNWVTQTAYDFNNSDIYRRSLHGGVWSPWEPINFGQLIRNNQGTLEYLDQGVWKPVGGSSQIMTPSDNVKHTDSNEYTHAKVESHLLAAIKVFTIQPNMKGTFRIRAEICWEHTTQQSPREIGLGAFSLDGNNNTNYRAGSDNQAILNSLFSPVGTGIENANLLGEKIDGTGGRATVKESVAQSTYKDFLLAVAVTGDYPVSVYAITESSFGDAIGTVLKTRNIRVSYDLI